MKQFISNFLYFFVKNFLQAKYSLNKNHAVDVCFQQETGEMAFCKGQYFKMSNDNNLSCIHKKKGIIKHLRIYYF